MVDVKGPKVTTNRNPVLSDTDLSFRRILGEQYEGDRNLYDVLGYKDTLKSDHYVAKYKRGPGIATALVDKPVSDCWGDGFEIVESEDTDVEETNFEREAKRFLDGEYTRMKPIARFKAADKWARLLNFSLILIGVSDDNVSTGNPEDLKKPVDEGSIDSLNDLDYLAVYDQRSVNWTETTKVQDPTDPRYRLPKTYNVDVSNDSTVDIHHSRLIHVVEDPGEDELKSPSIYKPIFNRLEDLQKLLGGSAEMFWRAAYPGLVLTPPTDSDGVPMKFEDGGDNVADQIKEYRHNLDRLMRVTGNVEKLSTDVASPESQISAQMQDISAHIDMPMSILRGNETGERATEEDRAMYHEFTANRQRNHCEQQIVKAIFDRLLDWGIMPSAVSGDESTNSYEIEWPPQEELTEQEEADVALTWAKAIKQISGGTPGRIASAAERRKKMGMDAEFGSEAPDIKPPEEVAAENIEVPEDELEEREAEPPT